MLVTVVLTVTTVLAHVDSTGVLSTILMMEEVTITSEEVMLVEIIRLVYVVAVDISELETVGLVFTVVVDDNGFESVFTFTVDINVLQTIGSTFTVAVDNGMECSVAACHMKI